MDDHSLDCLEFVRVRELLASYALTGLGRALAEHVHPVTRIALVRRWMSQVLEMQRLIEERGMLPFGGITDVRATLPNCAPPLRVTVEDVARIGDALTGTHAIAAHLRELPESYPELQHLAGRVGDFHTIAERIRAVIDERAQVRDDASPKLARVRDEIRAATADMRQSVERLLGDNDVRRMLQFPNHTFHGDRLVLPLKADYRGRLPGIIHRTSDTGATIYVEPAVVVELNNRITNLRAEEQEEIGRLLWDLAHEIHLNGREIHQTLDTLAVLDLIIAKVRFAKDFDLRCPAIGEECGLKVRGARHPLLVDLARRRAAAGEPTFEVVPIDYRLGHDFQMLIITGPNTGGKTVALKTIGLLSLMIQAGVPIPVAEGSEVGVYSHVLIDVGDEQSMQQSLSTFSAHLTRLLDMLRHAGPRALILIDELGAGTDPDEGAALGRAILDELLHLHAQTIVTTHLGALKGYALMRPGSENACVDFDTQTLCPTFHLRIGEPGHSNAIDVAQRLGMPRRLVVNARRNVSRKARALHAALEGTRSAKRQAEDARRLAEDTQLAAGRALTEAEEARARFDREQADFQNWVQRVVHLQPGDPVRVRNFDRDGKVVRLRLDQHRAEIDVGMFSVEVPLGDVLPPETPAPPPRAPRPEPPRPPPRAKRPPAAATPPGAAPTTAVASGATGDAAPPARPPLTPGQAAHLKPLDLVYVQRFQREGRVVRLKLDKQLATVSVGQLEIELPFEGLSLLSRRPPRKRRNRPPRPRPQREPATELLEAANPPDAASVSAPPPVSDTPPHNDPPPSLESSTESAAPAALESPAEREG